MLKISKSPKSILCLFVLLVVLSITSIVFYFCRGRYVLPVHPDYIGYYIGLNITNTHNFFGKIFYRIDVSDGTCGYWSVQLRRFGMSDGYHHYRGYYETGSLKEEGEIFVEWTNYPIPIRESVKNGKYYKPDGTLGSVVSEGNGFMRLWYPNGTLRFELELRNFQRIRLRMFSESGEIRYEECYPCPETLKNVPKRTLTNEAFFCKMTVLCWD